MLFRTIRLILLFCFPVILIGCGALFSVQEWSENYALMDGTQSTTPQAIDGNLNTIGDAIFPEGGGRLRLDSEVIITLPEKKKIRRIVVHTDNVVEFDVFVAKESQATERNWTLVKEIKKAKEEQGPGSNQLRQYYLGKQRALEWVQRELEKDGIV